VLIIDDDEISSRLFGAKLRSEGFEVIYANDGNEGREEARRLQPDLITNQDFSLEAEKAAREVWGVADYIHKSIDLGKFIARVKKALEEYKDKKNPDAQED
jgi:DNA-binding response OmpR family regulator